jgi:hypothetical protein
MSHAHNAGDLENFCIDFICLNEAEILKGKEWKVFLQITQSNQVDLFQYFVEKIIDYKKENFVQHSL